MRCLGHVVRMDDGRIHKDLLYSDLVQGKCPTGRPQPLYKDFCKRDLKAMDIDITTWEAVASDRTAWRHSVQKDLSSFEQSLTLQAEAKRKRRMARGQADRPERISPASSAAEIASSASDFPVIPNPDAA